MSLANDNVLPNSPNRCVETNTHTLSQNNTPKENVRQHTPLWWIP